MGSLSHNAKMVKLSGAYKDWRFLCAGSEMVLHIPFRPAQPRSARTSFDRTEVTRVCKSASESYELDDVHRRIRNILHACPATGWTLSESLAVLEALAGIIRARQQASDVIDFVARRSLS